MSDLGPFVAAALRARTVQELMDENNRLREELRHQKDGLMFRITGENGAPIYYEEMVTNGKSVGNNRWELEVSPISVGGDEITGITVPLQTYMNGLEFRLGEVDIRGGPLKDIIYKLKIPRSYDKDFVVESMNTFFSFATLRDLMDLDGVEEMKRKLNSVDMELLIYKVTFCISHLKMFIGGAAFKHCEDEGECFW